MGELVGRNIWNRDEYPIPFDVYYPLNNYMCQKERGGCGFGLPNFCGQMTIVDASYGPFRFYKPFGELMNVWRDQEECDISGNECAVNESGYDPECDYSSVSEWRILRPAKTLRGKEYYKTAFKIRNGGRFPITVRGGAFKRGVSIVPGGGGIFSYEPIFKSGSYSQVGFRCVLRPAN